MYVKKIFIIIAASVLTLLIAATVFQLVFWKNKVKNVETSYSEQIDALEGEIASIGPMAQSWTVNAKAVPGQKVTMEDLKPIELLEKTVGETFITDPQQIIGKLFKVAILPGTPITKDVLMEEKIIDTLRAYDVVSNAIPVGLKEGDYVDYRFVLPNGQDYIVISHKRVNLVAHKSVTLNLTEEEIHSYQSMLVDYFLLPGCMAYMTRYVEPGIQQAAKTYYPVSKDVLKILLMDPNILDKIQDSIIKGRRDNLEKAKITDYMLEAVGEGRKSVQEALEESNKDYWKKVEDALKAIEDKAKGNEGIPEPQPESQSPQAESESQSQESQAGLKPKEKTPTAEPQPESPRAGSGGQNDALQGTPRQETVPPGDTLPQGGEGSNNDTGIQEGIVQ